MEALTKTIGVFVLSSIIIGVPLLCGLSFVFNWNAFAKMFLIFGTFLSWVWVLSLIVDEI